MRSLCVARFRLTGVVLAFLMVVSVTFGVPSAPVADATVVVPGVLETGSVTATGSWVTVNLSASFTDPVVVAGGPGLSDSDPVTVRVRNVSATTFDVRLEEFEYQDGSHLSELVSYLVVERGTHALASGATVGADSVSVGSSFASVSLPSGFTVAPVVFASVSSVNEPEAVVTRLRNVGVSSFEVKLQEQETTKATHGSETVSWVAWDVGSDDGLTDPVAWESGSVAASDVAASVVLAGSYSEVCVLPGMTTTADSDTANVRLSNLSTSGFDVAVAEEASDDAELVHSSETVGWLATECATTAGNHAPVAGPVSVSGDSGTSISWLPVVFDPDSDLISCLIVASSGTPTGAEDDATVATDCSSGDFDAGSLNPGSYSFDYEVSDTVLTDTATVTVEVKAPLVMESGVVSVDEQWTTVPLSKSFFDPVVVAGGPGNSVVDPVTVRVRNVTTSGFELALQSYEYQSTAHPAEDVSYLVIEAGRHVMPSGAVVEAGTLSAGSTSSTVSFTDSFASAPVVVTAVTSVSESEAVVPRVDSVGVSSFDVKLQEQESTKATHGSETVSWIAVDAGSDDGVLDPVAWEAATVTASSTPASVSLTGTYTEACVVAGLTTATDDDPANARVSNRDVSGFDVFVDEEQSSDPEVSHASETVGYVATGCLPPLPTVDPAASVEVGPALVTTVAGDGTSAVVDGDGTAASFGNPSAVTVAGAGVVVVDGSSLRLVERGNDFTVTSWVGSATVSGCVDSTDPALVRFTGIGHVATDQSYVYVADQCSGGSDPWTIRKVDLSTGATSTVGGGTPVEFASLAGLAAGPDGYLYVSSSPIRVDRVDPTDGTIVNIRTKGHSYEWAIGAITVDSTDIYVLVDYEYDWKIERIDLTNYSNRSYVVDPLDAKTSVLVSAGDYLYGTSGDGEYLKRWDKSDWSVVVPAGSGAPGHANGVENEVWFDEITGIASDGSQLWVVDAGNYRLRTATAGTPLPRAMPDAVAVDTGFSGSMVSTIAGNGTAATVDGTGSAASFQNLRDVVVVDGFAYVAQQTVIRKVDLATGAVTTLAGQAGVVGENDSIDPALVTFDINVMVTDGYWLYTDNGDGGITDISNRIRRTSIATGATSRVGTFKDTDDFVIGPDTALYHVSGYRDEAYVRRIDPVSGESAVLAGSQTSGWPVGVGADEDMVWISTKGVGLGSAPELFSRYNLDTNALATCGSASHGYHDQVQSAGSDVIGPLGADVIAIDKTACSGGDLNAATKTIVDGSSARSVDPVTPGLALVSIAGLDWDGEAIYVVDSGTNRLRVIVDAFNPPGGFAMGYDGYGTWRHGVNAGLGNFAWSATDHAVGTIGPELAVSRTYNSSDPRVGPFGLGWTFNYDMRWEQDGGGNIVVLYPDGRRETHVPDGSGGWLAPVGYFSTLTGNTTTGFTLTMKDDTVYSFNDDGALTSIVDPNGHELELTYDSNDQLEQVEALVSERSLFFTWDGDHITEVETDPIGANDNLPYVFKYYYSGDELLNSCDPRDNTQTGVCHTYTYTNGKITQITKPKANIDARIGYFPSGEVQWRQDGEGYANGYQTSFAKPDTDTVVITDGNGNTSTQIFDDKYRLVEEQQTVDTVTYSTTYTYDEDGNRETVTDANSHTATMDYDERGNMTSVENGENQTSYFEYDEDDNLIASRDARSTSSTDTTYKTTFDYDDVGNKISEEDPLGYIQTWEYHDGTESAADIGFVPVGLLQVYREQRGNIDPQNPDGDYNTVYGYYHTGDLATVITPSGFRTDYTYDELGRLLTEAITDPDAGITEQVVATYTYDEAGNVLTVTGAAITDALTTQTHQLRTTNTFDDNSNLKTVTESDIVGSDPSRTTEMWYDLNDREDEVSDPQDETISREYDNVGNVTKVTDQNGTVTETVYDSRNLATDVFVRSFNDGHGTPAYDVHLSEITYDWAGRKLTETDAMGRVSEWTYDDADRVLTVNRLDFEDHSSVVRDVVLSATTYDAAGNIRTQITGNNLANRAWVTNTYDEAGRLDTSTLEMGVNDRVTDFDYDEAGNVTTVTRSQGGDSEVTKSEYDTAVRLTKTIVDPAGENLVTYFEYDARGNQTKTRDARSSSEIDNTYLTTTYYDLLSRPVRVVSPSVLVSEYDTQTAAAPQQRLGYDTYSNQTAVEDANTNVTTYEFDLLGRVVTVTHPVYDAPGVWVGGTGFDESEWARTGDNPGDAYKATDGSQNTYWGFGSGSQAAVFDLGEVTAVDSIKYWQYYGDGRTYHDSQVEVSVDGHNWTTVFGPAEVAFDASGESIAVSPAAATRYMRISSNGNTTNSSNHLVEVQATRCVDCPVSFRAYEAFSYDAVGNLESETSRRGEITTYLYDDLNRVVRQADPQVTGESAAGYTELFYNYAGELTAVVDAEGARTETDYDELGRVNEERVIVSQDELPNVYTWSYDYDDLGNRTWVQEPSGAETTSEYNAASELVTITDDINESASFEYDLASRKIKETDRAGRITEWFYDDAGRLDRIEQPASDGGPDAITYYDFDAVGNMTTVTSPRSNETEYDYDALSRLDWVTAPVVGLQTITTEYGYDAAGNNTLVVDGRDNEFWTTYNTWNLPEDTIEPETVGQTLPETRTWTTRYDPGGLPVAELQPGTVVIDRLFDDLGRLTSETGIGGDMDAARTYQYDLVGRVTSVSHPNDAIVYTYDDRGLLKTATDPDDAVVEFTYDENGRLIERSDAAGVHEFEWTSRNELDRYLDPLTDEWINYDWTDASQPDTVTYGTSGLVRDYTYDPAGFLETDTLENGAITVSAYDYAYDDDGNLNQKTVTLLGNSMTGVHDYTYDDSGRLKTWDAPNQALITYGWDDSGNRTTAGTDTWTYDDRNRLMTGPDGDYSYDPRGTLDQIGTDTYDFDALGRLVDYNDEVEYWYDGLDRVASRLSTGGTSGYGLIIADDNPLHWWHLDETQGSTTAVDSGSYQLNGTYYNNPTLEVDAPVDGTAMEVSNYADRNMGGTALKDQAFTIEFLARPDDLTRSLQIAVTNTGDEFNSRYGWTIVNNAGHMELRLGNKLTVVSPVDLVEGEWVHVVATVDSATDEAKLWVNNQLAEGTWTTTFKWYSFAKFKVAGQKKKSSRSSRWFDGGIDEISYWNYALDEEKIATHYDAFLGQTIDKFTYAGMGLDPVTDGTFTYSRTPAGRVMAQTDGTDTRWAGLDRHGDLTALLDPVAGTMTDTVVFDPFGDAVATTGTTGQTLGFQGDYTDPTSNEVWMGARWYNGADAAFRSRDTVFGELATPISLNRYTYAWANPLSYWDPDGRTAEATDECREYWSLSVIPMCDRSDSATQSEDQSDGVGGGSTSPQSGGGNVFDIREIPADYYRDLYYNTNPGPSSTTEIYAGAGGVESATPNGWNCDAGSMMDFLCDTASVISDIERDLLAIGHKVEACRQSTCGAVASLVGDVALDGPKSIWEAATGVDPITGEELGYWRTLGIVPFLSIFRRSPADEFFGSAGKHGDDVVVPRFDVHDRVKAQLDDVRMGSLQGQLTVDDLQVLIDNDSALRVVNEATGHISVIQDVDGVLLRITTAVDEFKIISVGPIRPNQVTNRLADGSYVEIATLPGG
ncbi:MAG: hypothetical protein GY788_09400 [bacterium]|nr:hypothetical protein [bacterium]